jgi:hypothetical protein
VDFYNNSHMVMGSATRFKNMRLRALKMTASAAIRTASSTHAKDFATVVPDVLHDSQIVKFLEFCDRSLVYLRSLKALKPKCARVYSGHYRVTEQITWHRAPPLAKPQFLLVNEQPSTSRSASKRSDTIQGYF